MGLSVWNQCDTSEYFSVSTIEKGKMKDAGLNLTVKELKERAKNSYPYAKILTGSEKYLGQHRKTNIYRYKDFK